MQFAPSDIQQLKTHAAELVARPLPDRAALERWVLDWSELESLVHAGFSRRRIAMTRNTADPEIREAYGWYSRTVVPEWERIRKDLAERYLDCAFKAALPARFELFQRDLAVQVELFRDENVDLLAKDRELRARHARMTGGQSVDLDGKPHTIQQANARLTLGDRRTRESTYRAVTGVLLGHAESLHGLLDEMLVTRGTIAANAGVADYRAYAFLDRARFDYGPADCLAFHDAVERVVVPVIRKRREQRRQQLELASLRPWDLRVDPHRPEPHRPFRDERGYIDIGRTLFAAVDRRFADEFDILVRNNLLDLMSRPGKAPGGYNAEVRDIRLPFIFSNAVGNASEVRTLLHEGGHAFHTLATRHEPVPQLANAPIEFAEVASMSMELFAMEHYGAAYSEDDARLNAIALLERRLELFPWVATIDAFQHWLYLHPGHTRKARTEQWLAIHERFNPGVDWSGLEDVRSHLWQNQQHIFRAPFYYIEYAIAAIGALQVWSEFRRAPHDAIESYRQALALGGTARLPDLFAAAGARFGMDETLLERVVGSATERLDALEA
ncbi:MAG: M3 family oligoendopeptidase [Planctomycetota bacterium]|nr:M3 family oligoendopeptidase [Planctomycetota bacterium]